MTHWKGASEERGDGLQEDMYLSGIRREVAVVSSLKRTNLSGRGGSESSRPGSRTSSSIGS